MAYDLAPRPTGFLPPARQGRPGPSAAQRSIRSWSLCMDTAVASSPGLAFNIALRRKFLRASPGGQRPEREANPADGIRPRRLLAVPLPRGMR